ncbi:MAG: hypothetical protein ACRD03_00680 [Acidimicrobiales bacterium]
MGDRASAVQVSGPLAPHLAGFRRERLVRNRQDLWKNLSADHAAASWSCVLGRSIITPL